MSTLAERLTKVKQRIADAEHNYNRPAESVSLLAVSKTQPAEAVMAAADLGQKRFGENYLQESLEKIAELARHSEYQDVEWHFIGAVQSNKTQEIAQHFDWVHSVDRLKIARRLSEQRPPERAPLNLCIQVNISDEESKSGCRPDEVAALATEIARLPNIRLRGLMAIPAHEETFEAQRSILNKMQTLLAQLKKDLPQLDTLSMGMSDDLEAAVAEGATMVRIGSAVFGPRQYRQPQ